MHFLISIIVFLVLVRIVSRLLGLGRHRRRAFNRGYGYGGRRQRFGGGLFSIVALVAFDRIVGGRW